MHRAKKVSIAELNQSLTCKLCKGYFVDATTIIECLHSFCQSCIVKYLESNKYCPVCDVQVHKSKPLLNIRPDKTLQDVVYKLVPRLLQNEIERRREFSRAHPEVKPTWEQIGEAYQHLLTPDESISLTLSYHKCDQSKRYLRCPAAVSVGHLQKLIRAKYGLSDHQHVDILHGQECLPSTLTLMDVAYISSWKRKGPLELSYRIYEYAATKPTTSEEGSAKEELTKEDVCSPEEHTVVQNNPTITTNNNNNWKEVQLRISENGEMSITGIQDEAALELVNNNNNKYKHPPEVEAKFVASKIEKSVCSSGSSYSSNLIESDNNAKRELPELKVTHKDSKDEKAKEEEQRPVVPTSSLTNSCASLNSTVTTKTVFSTINSTKCCVSTSESAPKKIGNLEKAVKRKLEPPEAATMAKQPKPTVLNHSIGLHNLSNNHPLKRHMLSKSINTCTELKVTVTSNNVSANQAIGSVFPKPASNFVNRSSINVPLSRPGTPIVAPPPKPVTKPCYMPKPAVINIPKPSISSTKTDIMTLQQQPPLPSRPEKTLVREDVRIPTSQSQPQRADLHVPVSEVLIRTSSSSTSTTNIIAQSSSSTSSSGSSSINNSKLTIKSKATTPIGYKTLRDPPKSWNSQIAKAKPATPDPKYNSDVKNMRPAKFFKMRNNMPRYLGNPASGVKPMYQVHVSPEKQENKGEIKKHSIVKIDPKTLKPISERAPETTSLSNNSTDLKINTSSVSIFNPLKLQTSKLQNSSPKSDRKSPKSPHSPKVKSAIATSSSGGSSSCSSPPAKRDKLNLNFTPSNPFIPNLASPNLNPNQFLYPTGPPGFHPPPYDPRVVAAYHTLLYGQRMAFPPGLGIDMAAAAAAAAAAQRKGYEMQAPTSPKLSAMTPPHTTSQNTLKLPNAPDQLMLQQSSSHSNSTFKPPQMTMAAPKKSLKEQSNKYEKSLQNAVKKLTQNWAKEIQSEGIKSATNNIERSDVANLSDTEKANVEARKPVSTECLDEHRTNKDVKEPTLNTGDNEKETCKKSDTALEVDKEKRDDNYKVVEEKTNHNLKVKEVKTDGKGSEIIKEIIVTKSPPAARFGENSKDVANNNIGNKKV